jgi:RNA polymerase sigma-70 factor (ECF subfamily)
MAMAGLKADLHGVPSTTRLGSNPADVESADPPTLQAAVSAHGGELFGFAYRSLRDRSLAEDAVQETFLRAWRARARYDASIGPMRSWLFAIERHVVIDLARARARRDANRTASTGEDVPQIEDQVDRSLLSWQVQEALSRLSPGHRQVLVATYYGGRTGPELAAELGIPEGTVRSRLFHALRIVRRHLEDTKWDE